MKLCLLVKNGKVIECSVVSETHEYGEHGDHVHMPIVLSEVHSCNGHGVDLDVMLNRRKDSKWL